jgi:hypothetical protein
MEYFLAVIICLLYSGIIVFVILVLPEDSGIVLATVLLVLGIGIIPRIHSAVMKIVK